MVRFDDELDEETDAGCMIVLDILCLLVVNDNDDGLCHPSLEEIIDILLRIAKFHDGDVNTD
jgi:hypothetical protein